MAELQVVEARLGREVHRRKVGRGGDRPKGIPAEVEGKIVGGSISPGAIWLGREGREVAVNLLSAAMQKPSHDKRANRGEVLLSQQAAHLLVYVLTGGSTIVEETEAREEGCRVVDTHSLYRYHNRNGSSSGLCVLCSLQHLCPVGYDLIAHLLGLPASKCESNPPDVTMRKYCTESQQTTKEDLCATDGAGVGMHHRTGEGGERTVTPATTASMSAVNTPRTPCSMTGTVSPGHRHISERGMAEASAPAAEDGWAKGLRGGWSSLPRNVLLGDCLSHPFFWSFETRMNMVQHMYSLLYPPTTPSSMLKWDSGEDVMAEWWMQGQNRDKLGETSREGQALAGQMGEEEIKCLRQNLEMWWRIGRRQETNDALVADWCDTAGFLLDLIQPFMRQTPNSNEVVDNSVG
eukprot:GHVS01075572.1.p1 GENE.GHVS01075572.1~~GHVS01075572.1.p1  ORF type:complete len:460 (+),score=66.53 GHVS01075572.1:164-1381(+)